jgi:hypothetical protein
MPAAIWVAWLAAAGLRGPADVIAPRREDIDKVRVKLEGMVAKVEQLLADGRSEERIAYCEDLDKQVTDLETYKHAHVAPHNFAVRAVESEVSWMCDGWVPERKLLLADHLASLKDAMSAYEEQLKCQPGSVPCIAPGGDIVGEVPDCSCACKAGWSGDQCETPHCSRPCVHGTCVGPDKCECEPHVVGDVCETKLNFSYEVGEWASCPGKGRQDETVRDVACVRSDGIYVEDELCGPAPPRVSTCCDPFTRSELPYQSCGEADDGCGGTVSFGDCSSGLGETVGPDSPYYTVISKLRELLAATESMLHHGSEQRGAACSMLRGMYKTTSSSDHFDNSTTVDADEWALDQVRTELTWLCDRKDAGPFEDGEIVDHLAGLKAVYDTYITRISCQPGDTPCSSNGAVKGLHPHCKCQCQADWTGAACDVPVDEDDAPSEPCDLGGTWLDAAGSHRPTIMVTDAGNPCAGAHEGGSWTYTVSADGKQVTLSDGTTGVVEGSYPKRKITWSNGITYIEDALPAAGPAPPAAALR